MWPFKKKQRDVAAAIDDLFAYEDGLMQSGFLPYCQKPAPRGAQCVFVRSTTKDVFMAATDDLSPYFNVANLWWKPWAGATIEQQKLLH